MTETEVLVFLATTASISCSDCKKEHKPTGETSKSGDKVAIAYGNPKCEIATLLIVKRPLWNLVENIEESP